MARRGNRKRGGVLELAFRSDWKFSAFLAGGSAFAAAVVIPALFGTSPLLRPLGVLFTSLAWLVAIAFAGIAAVRYFKQRDETHPKGAPPHASSAIRNATASFTSQPALTERDKEWRREPSLGSPPASPPARPDAWSLDVLDRVEWKRFEDLCCAFYREKGIRAETTRLGADGGVDIRLFQDAADPSRVTAVVQCKAWNKPVGVKEVRELRGVMAHEKAEKAFFMAPNGYTDDARAFATENRITLLDGKLFLAMLQRLPEDASKRLLDFATEGDWTTPTCPSCGGRMAARNGKRGPFWGCVTYPKCHATLGMRARPAGATE